MALASVVRRPSSSSSSVRPSSTLISLQPFNESSPNLAKICLLGFPETVFLSFWNFGFLIFLRIFFRFSYTYIMGVYEKFSKRISSYIYGSILMPLYTNTPYHGQILACAFFCDSSNFGFLVIFFRFSYNGSIWEWKFQNASPPTFLAQFWCHLTQILLTMAKYWLVLFFAIRQILDFWRFKKKN